MTDIQANFQKTNSITMTESGKVTSLGSVMAAFGLFGSPLGFLAFIVSMLHNDLSYMWAGVINFSEFSNKLEDTIISFRFFPISYVLGLIPSLITGLMYWLALKANQWHLKYWSSSLMAMLLGWVCTFLLSAIFGFDTEEEFYFDPFVFYLSNIGAAAGFFCGLIMTRLALSEQRKKSAQASQ